MEDNFVPLFAFASNLEFFGVFPECKSFVQNNIRLGEIVELPEGRGFAVVLGMGLLEFATNLSVLLSRFAAEGPFTHVVLVGICGAYPGRGLNVGDVVRVDSEVVGDLGVVESDGSFTPWHKVCATSANGSVPQTSAQVYESSSLRGVPAWLSNLKPVAGLSVNCCTGTASMAKERVENFNVDVESMEGAACFSICHAFGVPCYEIRAVSNFATTRDKSTWRIKDALSALRAAFTSCI
ncbi:futalosine hydrolase [Fibrobacter sp. UWB13]|uniref:futalosine hydrolase n=1 Tax=Fibrobacter sp. UWB13 TaxID=1896204 RepID=UPI000A0A2D32|nr:futalosine hydrolase [Fibrobacter sp. UWB13]SMG30584.1 futalosine hydrolase [Fibrobacter sp. UWB13]